MLAMMLNPLQRHFKSHVKKKGSYPRNIRYHPKASKSTWKSTSRTRGSTFSGSREVEILTTKNLEKANLYMINGKKI